MPAEIPDEKKEEIVEIWESLDDPNYATVSDKADVHSDTVKKYVQDLQSGEEELPDQFDEIPAMDTDIDGLDSVFPEPGDHLAKDFNQFLVRMNDEIGLGLKEKARRMLIGKVRTTGYLPQPEDLVSFLDEGDTGVKNSREIAWLGQQYQEWLHHRQRAGQGTLQQSGGFMGSLGAGGGMGGQPGMGQPQAGMGQQPQQGAGMQGGMNPMMMQMFQQMQQQMQQLQEQVQQAGQTDDSDPIQEKTQEFLEAKIEEVIESDSPGANEAVVQELRKLQGQIREGGQQASPSLGGDWRESIIGLVQSGDMKPDDAKDLLDTMGETHDDPKVLEMELEKDIREMEMENRGEQMDKAGEIFENLTDSFADRLASQLTAETPAGGDQASEAAADGGGGAAAPAQSPPETAEATAQVPTPSPADEACPHCGADLEMEMGGAACTECGFGIGPCGACGWPVEIPPRGEAPYGRCHECDNVIEVPDDPTAGAVCEECGWEGTGADLEDEYIICDGCNLPQPILRDEDVQAQQARFEELLTADAEELSGSDDEADLSTEMGD